MTQAQCKAARRKLLNDPRYKRRNKDPQARQRKLTELIERERQRQQRKGSKK